MAKSKKSQRRATSLASFFRRLWSQPHLLARFSQSAEGREEVVRQFHLSARHRKLLISGCMRDIIAELAGVKRRTAITTVINCTDEVECGHPECKAFMAAVRKKE